MSAKHTFTYDESKFKAGQREAALAMVEYEFSPKGNRKTKQDIADEIGISRKTLHNWNTQDQNFINYKNAIASDFMDSSLAFVYKKLLDSIERGSVRGMELYMKRIGDLADQNEITIRDERSEDGKTFEEREADLLKRLEDGQEGGE
jgi:hypothetical protein